MGGAERPNPSESERTETALKQAKGCAAFIRKPYLLRELLSRVKAVIRRRG